MLIKSKEQERVSFRPSEASGEISHKTAHFDNFEEISPLRVLTDTSVEMTLGYYKKSLMTANSVKLVLRSSRYA